MHTPEQRSKHPLCNAKKRSDGKPCRLFAGQGTDHKGWGRCSKHGGRTISHRKHAAVLEAQQKAGELGAILDVTPAQLMKGTVNLTAGGVAWSQKMVHALTEEERATSEGRALVRAFGEWIDRGAKVAKLAHEMGVDERMVDLAEHQTNMVAELIEALADDLKFTGAQRKALGPAVRRQLALMEKNNTGAVIEGNVK